MEIHETAMFLNTSFIFPANLHNGKPADLATWVIVDFVESLIYEKVCSSE